MLGAARTARKRMLPGILEAGQTITAIAGRDPVKLAEFQRDFAIQSVYGGLDAVLGDPAADAVYIPLPNSMHAEWAVRALAAGKRVLCEKPLALNLAEAERVIASAQHGVLLENFSYRSKTRDSTLISHFSANFSFQAGEEHRARFDRSLGGGSFLDLGCYGVDFAHRLFDCDLEILDVHATRLHAGDADESCVVRGRAGSATIEIATSFAAAPRQEFVLVYADGSEECIPRVDDPLGMLLAFAQMRESDPADMIRWRRNAAVYQQVLRRMQY